MVHPHNQKLRVLFSMALSDNQIDVRTRTPHVTIMVKKQRK
jgi:hypothetical protein